MFGYNNYNPNPVAYQMQANQNKLNDLQQYGYGSYPQYQQNTQQQVQTLKGRPVSSYDEAKASMIDFDGTLFVFTDIANHCIYTKQILLDGSAELKTYVLQEHKQNETKQSGEANAGYVLKKDFDRTVKELHKQIEELKEALPYDATDGKPNVKK